MGIFSVEEICGIRRYGKSYLLFNLFKDHLDSKDVPDDHIIEMAFDLYVIYHITSISYEETLHFNSF